MALSVMPMEKMETMTPIIRASCCFHGRGADEVAGLEVLRGVAGVRGGDADDAADGDGERAEGGCGPALDEEDGGGGHQGGDGHAGDGRGEDCRRCRRCATETVTKRNPKTTTRMAAARLASESDLRSGNGLELRKSHTSARSAASRRRRRPVERSCSVRRVGADSRARRDFAHGLPKPAVERAEDGGQRSAAG